MTLFKKGKQEEVTVDDYLYVDAYTKKPYSAR